MATKGMAIPQEGMRASTPHSDRGSRLFRPAPPSPEEKAEAALLPSLPESVLSCPPDGPCPWVTCRHHLWADVTGNGNIRITFPDIAPEDMEEPCSLRIASRGGVTLEELGRFLNVTRERARQLEMSALERFRRLMKMEDSDG